VSLAAEFELRWPGFHLEAAVGARPGEVTVVFGPSGCGKTTLLHCIAGLKRAAGRCALNATVWQDSRRRIYLPAHRRRLGVVFQDARLFDHLSVAGNLDYAARRAAVRERTGEVVDQLGLAPLMDRAVSRLSGGERQRVALGRALLCDPQLLLMDEPLASLDAERKREILPYLERVARDSRIPIVYVTHSLDEVIRLGDRLVLMSGGQTGDEGPVPELLARLDLPLAHREDSSAVLETTLEAEDPGYHISVLRLGTQRLRVPIVPGRAGERVRLRVQARDVSLALDRPERTSVLNVVPGRVVDTSPDREGQRLIRLDVEGQALVARISELSFNTLGLLPGRSVFVQIKGVALV
jgi:molybdate transport system ATP-binding protein